MAQTDGGARSGWRVRGTAVLVAVCLLLGSSWVGGVVAANAATIPVSITSPGNKTVQANVAMTLAAPTISGGVAPITLTVTGVPTGVTAAADGSLSGTPTTTGTYTVTYSVTEKYGSKASTTATITVVAAVLVAAPAAKSGVVGVALSVGAPTVSGGTGPYTITVTGAPPGMTAAADGSLSGTPTQAGPFVVIYQATDKNGFSASQPVTVIVTAPPPLTVTPPANKTAAAGVAMSVGAPTISGGTAPYTVTVTGLPTGMTAAASGALSGTPTTPKTYTVTYQAKDANGVTQTATSTITVGQALMVSALTGTWTSAAGVAISISPATVSGGTAPYTMTVDAATLPPGVTAGTNGSLSGTPTTAGSYKASYKVTDADGTIATAAMTIMIVPALSASSNAVSGPSGTALSVPAPTVSGGFAPYGIAVKASTLPPGLTAAADGSLSGTPTSVGIYQVSTTVTDDDDTEFTLTTTITIGGSISGHVFMDSNADGVRQTTETDISGVKVQLIGPGADQKLGTADDVVVSTQTTASPYAFANMAPGTYLVKVVAATLPAGVVATNDSDGGADQQITVTVAAPTQDEQNFGYALKPVPTTTSTPAQPVLAATGAETQPWLLALSSLFVMGGLALIMGDLRRRRHQV